jgi:hypothetical protein
MKYLVILIAIISCPVHSLDSRLLRYINNPTLVVQSPYSAKQYPVLISADYESQIVKSWGDVLIILNPFEMIIIRDLIQGDSTIYFSLSLIEKYATYHEIAHAEFKSNDAKFNECYADVMALSILTRKMENDFMRPFVLYRFAEFRRNSPVDMYKNHQAILTLIDFPIGTSLEAVELCKRESNQ